MPLNQNTAAARLVRELNETEHTIAEALIAASALLQTAALASRDVPEVPVVQSQSALLHLGKMVTGLIDARGEALRAHRQLLDAGREMGATESPYCPPHNATDTEYQQRAA